MEARIVMQARELAIGYAGSKKRRTAVHEGLAFSLYEGELVCLLGPNGAGKSTLLRTLAAFQPALGGELLCDGRPLSGYNERERSRKIGVVLTDRTQTGGLSVYELVALGRQPHTGFFGRLKADDRRVVEEALRSVGIAHKAGRYVAELSDGERQKAMIAKALVQECPVILLDEPTAFLDVESRIEVMQLLHTIARRERRTVLLSTHDVEQALIFADRLWLLAPGAPLRCGATEDLVFDGSMDRLFPRHTLSFDAARGGYTPLPDAMRPLVVEAATPLLRHWALNLAARYGYTVAGPGEVSSATPVLTVRSPHDLEWRTPTDCHKAVSFAEMAAVMSR